jgi:transposase
MFLAWDEVEIYVRPGITDMRKQMNGLAAIVQSEMKKNVFSGQIFLFCSRSRKLLKMLYWDRNGFCLWCKRLEQHKYPWPKDPEAALRLDRRQLEMLLDGIDFFHAHQHLNYSEVM